MFILISIVLFVIGLVLLWIDDNTKYYVETPGVFCTIFGAAAVAISLVIICVNYIGVRAYVAQDNERYDSIVYQYENEIYGEDSDYGKRELIVDIQEWNEDLAWYKTAQRDFWIGIYIPNVYDQFEFIELEDPV